MSRESKFEIIPIVPVSAAGVATVGVFGLLALLFRPLMWLLMFPLVFLIRWWPIVFAATGLWLWARLAGVV